MRPPTVRPLAVALLLATSGPAPTCVASAADPAALYDEACALIASEFYDPAMNGADWDAACARLRPRAAQAETRAEWASVVNEAIEALDASHTRCYTPEQREYYELLDVFFPDGAPDELADRFDAGPVAYVGIGLATRTIDGRAFAADVYDGGPADEAGIRRGDELLAVEGNPWGDVEPFRGREGEPTAVTIRRDRDADPFGLEVVPTRIRPHELFLESMDAGARTVKRDGARLAHVPVRSYAGRAYHERLKELLRGRFASADGLLLDLRAGWGGASPDYLDVFNPVVPPMSFKPRDGEWRPVFSTWDRPVVLLVDRGTRSGKEILAHAFKERGIGPVVGERTAGAVLGGSPRILADGSLLMIAVADVRVDGRRLEGVGVAPDVEADDPLPYAAGRDAALERALETLAERVRASRAPEPGGR